jgi:hypothetical protein
MVLTLNSIEFLFFFLGKTDFLSKEFIVDTFISICYFLINSDQQKKLISYLCQY